MKAQYSLKLFGQSYYLRSLDPRAMYGLNYLSFIPGKVSKLFLPTALPPLVLTLDTERCRHKMAKGAKPEPWNWEFLVQYVLIIFPLDCSVSGEHAIINANLCLNQQFRRSTRFEYVSK